METTGTIRAYFLFFGCIDILMHYGAIREGHEAVWISLIGLALPVFLSRYVWLVNSLLIAGVCVSFLNVYNRMLLDDAAGATLDLQTGGKQHWHLMST